MPTWAAALSTPAATPCSASPSAAVPDAVEATAATPSPPPISRKAGARATGESAIRTSPRRDRDQAGRHRRPRARDPRPEQGAGDHGDVERAAPQAGRQLLAAERALLIEDREHHRGRGGGGEGERHAGRGRERRAPEGPRGTIGSSARRSMREEGARRWAASADRRHVWPGGLARVSASTSSVSPAVTVTAPARRAARLRRGSSASTRGAASAPAAHSGTLTRNTAGHPNVSTSTPPSTQPEAPPPAAAAVHQPTARRRRRIERGSGARARRGERGGSRALDRARRHQRRRAGREGQASDAIPNTASPVANRRRWPNRSPARPATISRPPNASVYALRTHCRPEAENPSDRWISGSAIARSSRRAPPGTGRRRASGALPSKSS